MAKTAKQQLYEQLANQQVQQIMQQKQQEGFANFQAAYDQFQKDQEGLNAFKAQYDAWNAANQPVQQKTVNQVKEQPQTIPSLADVQTDRNLQYRTDKRNIALRNKKKEDYQRQQQEENILASGGQKPTIKDNGTIGGTVNQLDLSKYNLPKENGITEQDKKELDDYTKAVQWSDPSYKMTKDEQKEARRIASEGLQKIAEKYPVENKSDFGKLTERLSPEDLQKYRMYEDLNDKSNQFTNYAIGTADEAVSALGAALNTYALFHPEALGSAIKYQKEIQGNWDKAKQPTMDLIQGAAPALEDVPLLGDVSAYDLGKMSTQMAEYALTNKMFDEVGASIFGKGKLGGVIGNQIGQNAQDVALDTIPLIQELAKDGSLSTEDWGEVGGNVGANALGNIILGGVTEIPALAKWIKNKSAAKKAAKAVNNLDEIDSLVKNATNQAETATKNIEDLTNQIPVFDDVTQGIEGNPFNVTKKAVDTTASDKVDSALKVIGDPIDKLEQSGAMKNVTDTKALQKWEDLKTAYQNYIEAFLDDNKSYESLNNARKAMEAKRKAFARAMESVDPEIAKTFNNSNYGKTIGQAMYAQLGSDKTPKQIEDSLRAIYQAEGKTDAEIDDIIKQLNKDGLYDMGKGNQDLADSLLDEYTLNGAIDNAITREELEAGQKRLSDIGNKVIAEDTGIPKNTAEPETVKGEWKIEDTPENAPTEPKPTAPDNPNMKVSETYTNTGKNAGGWNEAEYTKYTDPEKYMYETIDEVRSVEEATNMRATEGRDAFKNRVLNAERVSSIELDGLMMEWRELTEEARALEEAGKDATKLWEESNKIFRKVQEQSTSNAQALQSLAKWSRNTPEGMLINAENIINGKNKVPQTELQKFIDKHFKQKKGNIEFSPEFEKEFLKVAESLKGLSGDQLDDRAAKEAMARLGKMVNEQLPVKFNEKLQSFLMDNMLGNFRTLISRNAGGNVGLNAVEQTLERPLAAGIDSLVSLKTGKRTQAGLSKAGIAEYLQGFGKGIKDELKDVKTGLSTARSGENTLENAIRSNRHVFKTKVADGLDGLVKHGLSVGDRPFYEAVYNQTLGDYNRLRARGLMGAEVQALSDADFKLYSETAAKMNALAAVYQQDSMLSNALMGFKKDIGMLSNGIVGVDILSQFSMPFVKTPANVIERAIDYSPLGAIRNAFRTSKELKGGVFDQNRFANETARNILGTGFMGGAAAYAANGGLTGSYSDNKNEKQAQKEAGFQEYAWRIPGLENKLMDISWIPVIGSNAVASAAAVDEFNKGEGSVGDNLTKAVETGGKALFDQSMFQGLQRLFGTGESYNSDEGIVGNMKNVVTSGVGQAIPSLLRQVAQVSDPYQRDLSYSNKGTSFGPFDSYAINSLANNIPGLRENYLAPKVDTSGKLLKENQGRNVGMKILEDMILPGKLTDYNMSPLAQEATRLSDATKNAFIPKADRSAIDTEDHTLTNDEWMNYQRDYYKQMTSAGEKIVASDIYKNANSETQAKILNEAYSEIKSAINSGYTGKEVDGAAKAYKEAGGGDKGVQAVVDYLSRKQLFENYDISSSDGSKAIYDAYGEDGVKIYSDIKKKLNGSTKLEDYKKALDSTSLSKEQKADYYRYINTSATPGQNPYGYVGGINYNPENDTSYQKAKKGWSNLTPEKYYEYKNNIDKNSSGVSQTEIADYLNKSGVRSQEEAKKIWNAFKGDNWKKSLYYEGGKWIVK